MSDQTKTPSGSAPAAPAGGRSTPAPPPAAKKKGASKGAKVAGGVAAAAAAVAAGLAYGEEVVDAASGEPEGESASDALGAAGPVGTPLVEAAAAPATGAPSQATPRPARRAESDTSDAPAARSASTAQPTASSAPAAPSVDAEFEAARATLLERLENFEAPAGTSPEDAAQLRQELIDTVTSFNPTPGQTTEQALAQLRNEYDDQVEDFTQDQKINALVEEAQRDNAADAGAEAVDPDADPDIDPDLVAEVDEEVDEEIDPDVDPQDTVSGVGDDSVRPTELTDGDVESNSFILTADVMQTAEVAPTGQQMPAADAGTPQIAREVPVGRGLRDDFEMLIAEPAPAEPLGRSTQDVSGSGLSGREVADGAGLEFSATEQPGITDAVGVAPAQLIDVAVAAPVSLADDVLGVVPAASAAGASEPLEMAVVDLGEPIVVGATDAVAQQLEQNQVIEFVDLGVEPVAEIEIESVPTPIDDLVLEEPDFAADLANEITPSRPDTMSFEP